MANDDLLGLIERRAPMGCGIGHVDAHRLASTAITSGARLRTWDERLEKVAARPGLRHTHDASR